MFRQPRIASEIELLRLSSICDVSLLTTVPIFSTRGIKTFDQRSMKVLSKPDEFKYYQRLSNDPLKASGVQFLTHFSHHHRLHAREREAIVDYLNWGKLNGQAHMPHRHQRVAFDFNDALHPTKIPAAFASGSADNVWWSNEASENGFPGADSSTSTSFNPHEPVWSNPRHKNAMFTFRHPQQALFRFDNNFPSNSLLHQYVSHSFAPSAAEFGFDPVLDLGGGGLPPQSVPGIHTPHFGEPDTKMMEAMAVPALKDGSAGSRICINIGRFSKSVYINCPERDNVLRGNVCRDLSVVLDMHTNGLRTKLVVLKAAQSGKTDAFCSGIDLQELAHNMRMHFKSLETAKRLLLPQEKQQQQQQQAASIESLASKRADVAAQQKLIEAEDYLIEADRALRDGMCLLWRVFSASRPLMTIINGDCRNIGNGLALFPKYAGLRESSEFIHDGTQTGLTPFGGLTHLLARSETTLKYPGLAEFVMLTGAPLYAGDVLRLGWSDLYSTMPDLDYHIRQWFDESEHMHNDAVAWQLGHLLDTLFVARAGSVTSTASTTGVLHQHDSSTMERVSLTPVRAKWIEDVFADQPSVQAILATLTEIERLPLSDPNNTTDANFSRTATQIGSDGVEKAIEKLRNTKMHFSLTPWDVTDPPEDVPVEAAGEIFRNYYFESIPVATTSEQAAPQSTEAASATAGTTTSTTATTATQPDTARKTRRFNVAARHDTQKLLGWRRFRKSEFEAFQRNKSAAHPRHVFARVEGCESDLLVDFEFSFDSSGNEAAAAASSDGFASAPKHLLTSLKQSILQKLRMPEDRDIDIMWNLPTLDTARVRNDVELLQLLHADPGLDDPHFPTRFPPIYFTVVRRQLHFSEWAYCVKHQLLLACPFALKASFALLKAVRGPDGTEEQVKSVSESLALEFRFATRMMRRRDFYEIGSPSLWPASQWAALKNKTGGSGNDTQQQQKQTAANGSSTREALDAKLFPVLPNIQFEDVFERDVEIDGHRFVLRPRWEPRTLEAVNDEEVAAIGSPPLSFSRDRTTELHAPTETNMGRRITETVFDHLGYEVVPGLGERDAKSGKPLAAALQSNAYVPNNVNFYEMARHPWDDTATSWRSNGFTEGSLQYFHKKIQ